MPFLAHLRLKSTKMLVLPKSSAGLDIIPQQPTLTGWGGAVTYKGKQAPSLSSRKARWEVQGHIPYTGVPWALNKPRGGAVKFKYVTSLVYVVAIVGTDIFLVHAKGIDFGVRNFNGSTSFMLLLSTYYAKRGLSLHLSLWFQQFVRVLQNANLCECSTIILSQQSEIRALLLHVFAPTSISPAECLCPMSPVDSTFTVILQQAVSGCVRGANAHG